MADDHFATRLNSFASGAEAYWPDHAGKPSVPMMLERAGSVDGLTHVDLNYPDHVEGAADEVASRVIDAGLSLSGLAMRYYSDPAFKRGGFTNPEKSVRNTAIDLTRRGIDEARRLGSNLLTIWPGQDGFDQNFQADYGALWGYMVEALAAIAAHDPDCEISLEYKPNEPRAYSIMPDCASTLLLLKEVGAPNTGVTIDFAHSLYADEQPALAAALVSRHSKLLGVHLNDGHAKRDDGLMVGAVHLQATLELLLQVRRDGFAGPLYFDTFPDVTGLDPVAECETNIAMVRRLVATCERLDGSNALSDALDRQDAVAGQAIVNEALLRPVNS